MKKSESIQGFPNPICIYWILNLYFTTHQMIVVITFMIGVLQKHPSAVSA